MCRRGKASRLVTLSIAAIVFLTTSWGQTAGTIAPGGGETGVEGVPPDTFPPPDIVNYLYVYRGETFSIDQNQMEVLKRLKGPFADSELANLITNTNIGLVDLRTFVNAKIQFLNIYEDRDGGYEAWIDFQDGRVSLNLRYTDQPVILESPRLTAQDIPSDSVLIEAARKFLVERGVSLASHGEPFVRKDWLIAYEQTGDKAGFIFPNTAVVVFPIQINGHAVLDESGFPTGISVNVSYPEMVVMNAWDIMTLDFERSLHDAETDVAKLLEIASRGGMYGYPVPDATRTVEIGLDTPTIELVRMWIYENNRGDEVFVPALIFPVIDKPADQYFYPEKVVVPLIVDILNRTESFPPPSKPASGDGVARGSKHGAR